MHTKGNASREPHSALRVAVEPSEHVRVLFDDGRPFEFERRRELSRRLGEVERQDGELLDALRRGRRLFFVVVVDGRLYILTSKHIYIYMCIQIS